MEEKNTKQLNPIAEIIIILLISLVCNYFSMYVFYDIRVFFTILCTVIAALLCMKVIGKRKTEAWKIILISLGVSIFMKILNRFVLFFAGGMILFNFYYVLSMLEKILEVVLIVVFVNVLDSSKTKAKTKDIKFEFNLDLHILLLILTFGIWRLIWIYRMTECLNCVQEEETRNPALNLLLCMVVPFYSVYWTYKSAEYIDTFAKSKDVRSDLAILCLFLEIFIPIVPPILMQDKINKIIEKIETN